MPECKAPAPGGTTPSGSTSRQHHLPERWWFNAAWFQLTWLCAVLGREALLPLTVALIALHLALVREPLVELRKLLPVAALGIVTDSALSLAGVFQFPGLLPIPLWLCALWLAFATTLDRSLDFLRQRRWLACVLGAPAALNYLAGERLGAVEFGHGTGATLALLVPLWMLLLPTLCALHSRITANPRRKPA